MQYPLLHDSLKAGFQGEKPRLLHEGLSLKYEVAPALLSPPAVICQPNTLATFTDASRRAETCFKTVNVLSESMSIQNDSPPHCHEE